MALRVTGRPIPAEIWPGRTGDPGQPVVSSEKEKWILGWKPQYADLETIVTSAWNWHKAHPSGFGENASTPYYDFRNQYGDHHSTSFDGSYINKGV